MRGRQSINPLKKYGFATIKNQKILITDLGKQFLKDDYISGRQFLKLQSALNDILRSGEKLDLGAPTKQNVKNFTTAMTTTINDFDNFKVLDDPAKNQFKNLFVTKFNAANKFMMEHQVE